MNRMSLRVERVDNLQYSTVNKNSALRNTKRQQYPSCHHLPPSCQVQYFITSKNLIDECKSIKNAHGSLKMVRTS